MLMKDFFVELWKWVKTHIKETVFFLLMIVLAVLALAGSHTLFDEGKYIMGMGCTVAALSLLIHSFQYLYDVLTDY